ncbi:MAG: hypothetical protein EAZ65_02480 [Verrucomicrobia bacterium]|nr:MAG: hypothetical protein EAZ84_04740 [Verrucomicrobiota bacterium]TAE88879.1 MAG: hypothetical protein EAZ82_02245 [Verrucomicrobiota bacterium]TAF27296.1 MAG: hypothetical protein EAZ71_02210 [Verrucomicrobiota bacterium]TAF42413.1 MAG: hypothetical protein EAZ65_02480 [Verrucomicrobiota bacterium]
MKTAYGSALAATLLASLTLASANDFNFFGDYLILRQTKVTGNGKVIDVPIKPLKLSVSTDGVNVRIHSDPQGNHASLFAIYRSDGIGRQTQAGGPLEVVPGIQATSIHGGVHKHLRLTRDALILTVFPGVSDQTLITHASLVPPSGTSRSEKATPKASTAP